MGDAADDILNGDVDEETGEWIGDGQGFPRSLQREEREYSQRRRKAPSELTDKNKVNGVMNYLHRNYSYKDEDCHKVIKKYATEKGFLSDDKPVSNACIEIQKDFAKFVGYINKKRKDEGR